VLYLRQPNVRLAGRGTRAGLVLSRRSSRQFFLTRRGGLFTCQGARLRVVKAMSSKEAGLTRRTPSPYAAVPVAEGVNYPTR